MSISALGIGTLRTSSIRPRSQLPAPASPPSSNSDSKRSRPTIAGTPIVPEYPAATSRAPARNASMSTRSATSLTSGWSAAMISTPSQRASRRVAALTPATSDDASPSRQRSFNSRCTPAKSRSTTITGFAAAAIADAAARRTSGNPRNSTSCFAVPSRVDAPAASTTAATTGRGSTTVTPQPSEVASRATGTTSGPLPQITMSMLRITSSNATSTVTAASSDPSMSRESTYSRFIPRRALT